MERIARMPASPVETQKQRASVLNQNLGEIIQKAIDSGLAKAMALTIVIDERFSATYTFYPKPIGADAGAEARASSDRQSFQWASALTMALGAGMRVEDNYARGLLEVATTLDPLNPPR